MDRPVQDTDVQYIDATIPYLPGQTSLTSLTMTVLKDRQTAIQYAKQVGLIKTSKRCPSCKQSMQLRPTPKDINVGVAFQCRKSKCKKTLSCRTGTWTDNANIPLEKIIALTYCFAEQMTEEQTLKETSYFGGKTSTEMISDWYSYCREVCVHYISTLQHSSNYQIGGPGLTVEIDETLVGQHKDNRSRLTEGKWVLGGYCRETNDIFLELCPENKRSRAELIPIIEKRVKQDSIIITDEFEAYKSLPPSAYSHLIVNHSKNFVDPETGAHTQSVKSLWSHLKTSIQHQYKGTTHLAEHLCEFLWRCNLKKRPVADAYAALLEDIQLLYPTKHSISKQVGKPKPSTWAPNIEEEEHQPVMSSRSATEIKNQIITNDYDFEMDNKINIKVEPNISEVSIKDEKQCFYENLRTDFNNDMTSSNLNFEMDDKLSIKEEPIISELTIIEYLDCKSLATTIKNDAITDLVMETNTAICSGKDGATVTKTEIDNQSQAAFVPDVSQVIKNEESGLDTAKDLTSAADSPRCTTESGKTGDKEISKKFNDSGHFESEENMGDESELICENISSQEMLDRHSLCHSQGKCYTCEVCGKCFTKRSNLNRHTFLHLGINPYKCEHCERCFKQKSHLKAHTLVHLGTKAHKCVHCGRRFTQKSSLNRHVLLHLGTKPYTCEHCDKCFARMPDLKLHALIHLGTTLYACEHCDKCFKRRDHLKRHSLVHSGT